jgi:hypothetical protein
MERKPIIKARPNSPQSLLPSMTHSMDESICTLGGFMWHRVLACHWHKPLTRRHSVPHESDSGSRVSTRHESISPLYLEANDSISFLSRHCILLLEVYSADTFPPFPCISTFLNCLCIYSLQYLAQSLAAFKLSASQTSEFNAIKGHVNVKQSRFAADVYSVDVGV